MRGFWNTTMGGLFMPLLAWGVNAGCLHVPLSGRASFRKAEYFATHRELSPSIAAAIEVGHVIRGMDREQVKVVLGEPLYKKSFKGQPLVEVWLYPGHKIHQDQLRSHGAGLFRIVFLDGRAVVLEPI